MTLQRMGELIEEVKTQLSEEHGADVAALCDEVLSLRQLKREWDAMIEREHGKR